MAKQVPLTLEIGGEQWDIYLVSPQFLKKEDAEGALGLTDYTDYRVYLLRSLSRRVAEDTLLHELLHCGFSPNRAVNSDNINEELACELGARTVKDILRQQAKIKKWLTRKFHTTTGKDME